MQTFSEYRIKCTKILQEIIYHTLCVCVSGLARFPKYSACSSSRETLFGGGCYGRPRCLSIWKRGNNPGNVHMNGSLIRGS